MSAMIAIRHAIENASQVAATDAQIVAILRGEGGDPSHLRALFGDVSALFLEQAGAEHGIAFATILDAYRAAGAVAAANPELDQMLAEPW